MSDFTFIDLFAGIGGMRIAFERNGGKCVFSSEWDKFAQKTYETNFGECPHGDITKINEKDIPDFDVLVGGFPCQPFSMIGKREGFSHPTQGTLFFDIVRILKEKRPKAFLLENVPGLLTSDEGKTFEIIKKSLIDLDYSIEFKVLDAADFGLPQVRKRLFIVGFNNNKVENVDFKFPLPNTEKVYIKDYLEENPHGYSISEKTQNNYLFKLDDGKPQVIDKSSKIQVKTLVASYHKIQRLTGTFVRGGETGLRLLSELECKRIMGFPDDYIVPVSRTQMYRQFGNSVAISVVQAIAANIAQVIKGEIAMVKKSSATEILKDLLKKYPLKDELLPHQIVEKYYNLYLEEQGSNNSMNGKVFENILLLVLIRAGIEPIYYQAKLAFVPNVDFDILLYNRKMPVSISAKTSLRERWKQADIEAMAMKYVHRKALCYVVTLSEKEVNVRRKEENSYVGIDEFILANKPEFDTWLDKIKKMNFKESETIQLVENAETAKVDVTKFDDMLKIK